MPQRLVNGQVCADCRRHGFLDHSHIGSPSQNGRVDDRAFFHLGDARWNADDHGGLDQPQPGDGLAHKVGDHFAGDVEVGDDAVLHGAHCLDALGRAAQIFLGGSAYGENRILVCVYGHHRWFIDHDAVRPGVKQGVGSAKIHGNVFGQESEETP